MIDAISLYNRVIDQGGLIDISIERVSSTQLDIKDTDLTSFLKKGMAIEVTDSAATKYGFISATPTLVSGDTRVTALWATSAGTASSLAVGSLSGLYVSQSSGMRSHPGFVRYTPGNSGWSSTTTVEGSFSINGRQMVLTVVVAGTSNAGETRIDLPSGFTVDMPGTPFYEWARNENSGAAVNGMCEIADGRTFLRYFIDVGGSLFSSSGNKTARSNTTFNFI
jgi:hypothetical protein